MKPNETKATARLTDHPAGAYIYGTSLLSVSTAGRGASSSEVAPAFFPGSDLSQEVFS